MNPSDDLKYQDVTNTLRQLQQVKAPSGFEADLFRRINSAEYPAEKPGWHELFTLSRLVPTAALAVTALLLIFVLNQSGLNQENPLNTAPRERQDITFSSKGDNSMPESKTISREEVTALQQNSGIQAEKDRGIQNRSLEKPSLKGTDSERSASRQKTSEFPASDKFITADFASGRITDYPVNKAGLNFRQVNLSNKEKTELNQMKEKLETMFKTREKQ